LERASQDLSLKAAVQLVEASVEVVTLVLQAVAWEEMGVLVLRAVALEGTNPELCGVLAVVVPNPDQDAVPNLALARDQGWAECQVQA
jgi:hypothetical protein